MSCDVYKRFLWLPWPPSIELQTNCTKQTTTPMCSFWFIFRCHIFMMFAVVRAWVTFEMVPTVCRSCRSCSNWKTRLGSCRRPTRSVTVRWRNSARRNCFRYVSCPICVLPTHFLDPHTNTSVSKLPFFPRSYFPVFFWWTKPSKWTVAPGETSI